MCVGVPQVLLYSIMFTLRTSVLPPLSAVGAIVAILTDGNGASLTGGAVGGEVKPRAVITDSPPLLLTVRILCLEMVRIYLLILTLCVQASLCCFLSSCSILLRT